MHYFSGDVSCHPAGAGAWVGRHLRHEGIRPQPGYGHVRVLHDQRQRADLRKDPRADPRGLPADRAGGLPVGFVQQHGWWQVDYSKGDMRPQFDKVAQIYAELANAGLYIMPESVTTFSNHSCCGMHGGDIYAGDLLAIPTIPRSVSRTRRPARGMAEPTDAMVTGRRPTAPLFSVATLNKRIPSFSFQRVPPARNGIPRRSPASKRSSPSTGRCVTDAVAHRA